MKRVGLTGNIASGKTTVADLWRSLGAPVIDADQLARRAIEPGTPGYERVMAEFGTVDRAVLRDIVFKDDEKRRLLESIIHPEVNRMRKEEEAALEASGSTVVVHDIPLLFELGMQKEFDAVVLVDAPEDIRIARIVKTRGLSEAEARRMVDSQMPSREKRILARYVIHNTGSLDTLRNVARRTWAEIAGMTP